MRRCPGFLLPCNHQVDALRANFRGIRKRESGLRPPSLPPSPVARLLNTGSRSSLTLILPIRHVLHPLHHFSIEALLNRDVSHPRRGRRSVPVLLVRWEPHNISRTNFLHRAAFTLGPATTRSHDERLPERMRVPCGPCAWFKSDARTLNACRLRRLK